jgi:hypothetical protein
MKNGEYVKEVNPKKDCPRQPKIYQDTGKIVSRHIVSV